VALHTAGFVSHPPIDRCGKPPLFGCSPTAYSIYCIGSWKSFIGGRDDRLVGAGRKTVSHASPKATKTTGHLIFPQLGSAAPLHRVALLLMLERTERQT